MGQQPFEKVRVLNAHSAQVGQPGATTFAIQFLDAPKQPLDAEKISLRMPLCIFSNEGCIATAQFDFKWLLLRK